MAEKILLDIQLDQKGLTDKLANLKDELIDLQTEQKALNKAYNQGEISQKEYAKATVELEQSIKGVKDEQKDVNRQLDLSNTIANSAKNSYENLTAQYALAQKELKKLEGTLEINEDGTVKLSEAYKEQLKQVEKAKAGIIEFDKAIKNGSTNVGLYDEAIQKAFGMSINEAKENFLNFGKSLLTNPFTFIIAGVALLAKVLLDLFAKFKETEEGAGAIGEVMAKLGQIFNATFNLVKPLFSAIVSGLNTIVTGATKVIDTVSGFLGFATNLEKSADEAGRLAKELKDIEKAERALVVANAANLKEQERLKNIRDVESNSLEDRIQANEKLGKIELERLNNTLELERRKLKALEEKAKLEGESNLTQEQQNEIVEQRVKVQEAEADSLGRQNEQLTNRVALEKEIFELRSNIKNLELEQEILQGKITEGSKQELDRRTELIKENLDNNLKQYQGNAEKQREITLIAENEILSLTKDFNQKQADAVKEATAKANEERQKQNDFRIAQKKMELENELLETKAGTEEEYQARLQILAFNYNLEREQLVKQKQDTSAIDLKFQLERAKMEQDFDNQKMVRKMQQAVQERQLDLQNADLTAQEKLDAQRALIQAETDLKLLQLADDDAREEERRLILEEKKIKDKELAQEEYELGLEEDQAKFEFELQNEGLKLEERLALELAYEENRKQRLLAVRGLTASQIERIEEDSERKKAKIKQSADLAKIEAEEKLAKAQMAIADGVFTGLQLLAGKNKELQKALFLFQKGFAVAEVIQNGMTAIAKITAKYAAIPGGVALAAAEIAATKIQTAVGVATIVAQTIGESQRFQDGGILEGPSHAKGGIPIFVNGGRLVEAEGGEFIVNKTATSRNLPLLKAINQDRFENGGLLTNNAVNSAVERFETQNALSNLPKPTIQVAVTDINLGQSDFAIVQDIGVL